jgi:lipoprotein-anchoring transpeptidase ErfK/SrfK
MNSTCKIAFALGLFLTTAVPSAFSQETPKADAATTVLKPKPATTAATNAPAALPPAPAMSSSIASKPPVVSPAVTPVVSPAVKQAVAVAPAAPAATADIRLPAPKLALPLTPPPVPAATAKVEVAPAPAKTAAAPAKPATANVVLNASIGAKAETPAKSPQKVEEPAKPVKKAAAPKKPAKESVKTAKAEPAEKPKPFSLFKKKPKEEAVAVKVKAEAGSVVARTQPKFFFGWFDAPKPELEPLSQEQTEYDMKLASVPEKKKFKVKEEFVPVTVPFKGYKPGTIVINTQEKYLYFVESPGTAVRYGVAVGKEGLLFTGKATVGAKQPWPRWIPTKDMIGRDPAKYGKYADGMDGGPDNPLGARAIYLYQGKQDTYLRIHGTNQPQSIGTASSNGCFRMINEHVIDLYKRVPMGAEVVVL